MPSGMIPYMAIRSSCSRSTATASRSDDEPDGSWIGAAASCAERPACAAPRASRAAAATFPVWPSMPSAKSPMSALPENVV